MSFRSNEANRAADLAEIREENRQKVIREALKERKKRSNKKRAEVNRDPEKSASLPEVSNERSSGQNNTETLDV